MFDAITRAAEIMHRLLQAAGEDDPMGGGVDREELADLLPFLGLEHLDRRAGNRALRGLALSMDTDAAMQAGRGPSFEVARQSCGPQMSVRPVADPSTDSDFVRPESPARTSRPALFPRLQVPQYHVDHTVITPTNHAVLLVNRK